MYPITPFETRYLDQLDRLPPENWQSNAYDLFMQNDWQPWFHAYQVMDKSKLIGFGMIFHFEDVAWLGWILVDKKYRNQGIGTDITQHLMNESKRLGAAKLVLTATELGAPIYEKLGFKTTSWYHFMSVPTGYQPKFDKAFIRPAKEMDLAAIAKLDFLATGEKREALLKNHLDATFVYTRQSIEGFYIQNLATGLVIASTPEAGEQLNNYRLKKKNNKIIVPDGNELFLKNLVDQGFNETAKVPRMTLGDEPNWQPEMIYNRAGGYCG